MRLEMRKQAGWLVLVLLTVLAVPALAEEDDFEEEEELTAWGEYREEVRNRSLIGVNSLVTFPADPVMDTVEPREEFDDLPGAVVSKRVAGFFQGTLLGVYRLGMGALDVLFAPLTPMRMLSPEPRYMLFEGVEHDDF